MKERLSRGLRRGLAGLVLLGSLLPAAPAHAESFPKVLVCQAAAIVAIIPAPPGPGANQWTITGKGSCLGDNDGTYFADVSAVGTSDTLGMCDGDVVMHNFELSVTVTLTSTSGNPLNNKVFTETWSAPLTTFPTATPFLISDGGLTSENDFVGAGAVITHLYQKCPPLGSPSGQLAWTRTL